MTEEEKSLLLADLCARLPYGVMIQIPELFYPQRKVVEKLVTINDLWHFNDDGIYIENVKPYLRSMDDMTEEEKEELLEIVEKESDIVCEQLKNNNCGIKEGKYHFNSVLELYFLLSHHFDFRGLIPKGLALKALEGMYN